MTYQPPPPPPGQPPQGPSYQGPSYQGPPPPPPQGQPPAGPPPGQWGQPQGGPPAGQWGGPTGGPARPGGSFDPKTVDPLDWGIIAAGVLAFIFSFVSYYTYSYGPYSASLNAWHGFFGWFAMLLALVGSAAVALDLFMPHVKLPFPNRLVGLAAYALAVICVILALFVTPGPDLSGTGIDEGHGFGYWISLIVIIAGAVLSFLRFQRTGGQLPIGANRPGGTGRAPGGGYGPPPGPPPSH